MNPEPSAVVPPGRENGAQSTPPGQRGPVPDEVVATGVPPATSEAEESSPSRSRATDQDQPGHESIDSGMRRAAVREMLTRTLLDVATATLRAAALNVAGSRDGAVSTESVTDRLNDVETLLALARTASAVLTAAAPRRGDAGSESPDVAELGNSWH